MKARDAAMLDLDATTDDLSVEAADADDVFGVVDLLESQAPLRRSLSDPSASGDQRAALATRLFSSRISEPGLTILTEVARTPWASGRRLVNALERQGVRALLIAARNSGDLEQVQRELHAFATTVEANHELADALRSPRFPLEGRRALVARLVKGRVHPITEALLSRAAAARVRTLPLTVASYLEMAAASSGQQIARVTVARPLDEARAERLRKALEAQVEGPVWLQIEVDPAVLGGMDVTIGDDIIESTTAGRLEQARRLLTTH